MASRLFQELREERGLAYYISTNFDCNPDTGQVVTYTGIDHKKINEVTGLIIDEHRRIKEKAPTLKEVNQAKESLKGNLRLSLEIPHSIAAFYARQELLEDRILTPEEKIKAVEKVRPFEIKEVAQEIFKRNKLNLVVISPKKKEVKNFKI